MKTAYPKSASSRTGVTTQIQGQPRKAVQPACRSVRQRAERPDGGGWATRIRASEIALAANVAASAAKVQAGPRDPAAAASTPAAARPAPRVVASLTWLRALASASCPGLTRAGTRPVAA